MLPAELLIAVVDYLIEVPVQIPTQARQRLHRNPFNYSRASPELATLSLVNRVFRRVCIPSIFAYVECTGLEKLKKLNDHFLEIPIVVNSIQTLHLRGTCTPEALEIVGHILPLLASLKWLDLDAMQVDGALLDIIDRHPTLKTVAVLKPPRLSISSSLSKFLLHSGHAQNPEALKQLEADLRHGIQLWKLRVSGRYSFVEIGLGELHVPRFPRLRELEISMNGVRSISWLPPFVEDHPDLTKVTLVDDYDDLSFQRSELSIPFIIPFFEATTCFADFILQQITVTRHTPSDPRPGSGFEGWDITSLRIQVSDSLLDVLRAVSTSWPGITELAVDVYGLKLFHVDDFISTISSFRHLRTIAFPRLLQSINFGHKTPWLPAPRRRTRSSPKEPAASVTSEAALRWYTTRITSKVPSLEAFYVEERGEDGPGLDWNLIGWYLPRPKLLVDGGGIELGGTVPLKPPERRVGYVKPVLPNSYKDY
ncbi:hypothetical protein C8R44DRAFT_871082 [Mycena epipterygia]|nr:hypothetical protein C8R44DRAFT_871082 [Mycena epipterygia]